MSALLLILRRSLAVDGLAFSSVYQGGIRPNIYIAMSAAIALLNATGLSQASVVIAALPIGLMWSERACI